MPHLRKEAFRKGINCIGGLAAISETPPFVSPVNFVVLKKVCRWRGRLGGSTLSQSFEQVLDFIMW